MGKKKVPPMDPKRFWDLISCACRDVDDWDDWLDSLVQELARLPPEDMVAFDRAFSERTARAYTVDLWGAAYLINGGASASDDGFYYFRCWLVGMGKQVYENALANPDSLADVVNPDEEYEAEIYGAGPAAWRSTGRTDEEFDQELERQGPVREGKLRGKDWDFNDDEQVRRRFPRLAAMYLSEADE